MDFIYETGPFFYVLFLLILMLFPLGVVVMATSRWMGFHGIGGGAVGLLVSAGFLGTTLGLTQAFEAVAYASAEMKTPLMLMGIEIALNTTWMGLGGAAVIVMPFVIAWFLRKYAAGNWFWMTGTSAGFGAMMIAAAGGGVLVAEISMMQSAMGAGGGPVDISAAALNVSIFLTVGTIVQGLGVLVGGLAILACLGLGPAGWWWDAKVLEDMRQDEAPGPVGMND